MQTLRVNDLGRLREIAQVLARHGFRQALELVGLDAGAPPAGEAHTAPFARRLRTALTDLGPTFVKLGQILSLRPDILPADVLAEFQTLQDDVPPMPWADVEAVLLQELSLPIESVFAHIDPEPLGAASIAQVHGARLLDGTEVAVKLQRRGIERIIQSDLHILYALAQLVEGRLSLPGLYTPTAIVREFDAAITQELDFLQELKAAERLARDMAETDARVPAVHPRWSTRRLLVMERIDGRPLRAVWDTLPLEQRRRLAHQLMEATYTQVFVHGFFHGDPHPGNLLVADDRLVYLDFGITGVLTASMQDTVVGAFTAMAFRDPDALAGTIYRAGATRGRIDLRALRAELERKMVEYHGASLDDLATRETFMEVIELATRFEIVLPAEFAVLSRAISLIEGTVRRLLPGIDIVEEVRPYAQRLMMQRFSPERLAHDVASSVMQVRSQLKDLPTQATQVLMDLDAGRLQIVTRDPDGERLREELRTAAVRLSLAAVGATWTLGGFLFLAHGTAPSAHLAGLLLLALGTSVFGAMGLHVFVAGLLDLDTWTRRVWNMIRFFSWRRED